MSVSGYTTKASSGSVTARDYITRPNDSTQYAAGDAISDNTSTPTAAGYFTFAFGGMTAPTVVLTDFYIHKSAQGSTNATFALLLFTARPALAGFEDNAASAITDTEMRDDCVGVVQFAAADWNNVATGDAQNVAQNITVTGTGEGLTLYGVLIAQAAYTPGASEVITVACKALR
jgi:hypothetical protein